MTEELLQIYNPLNARRLTKEQIDDMQRMTVDEIKELAHKYPNGARGGAYLVLRDKAAKSQIYPLSTWANLYNLITKQGKKNYVPFSFRELFNKTTKQQPEIPLGKVQDLTREEIVQAEGLKFVNDYMPGFPQMEETKEPFQERYNKYIEKAEKIEAPKRSHKKKA